MITGWSGDPTDPNFVAHGWDGQGGVVKPAQYNWLASELQAHGQQPTVVFMHHPPIDLGLQWLDAVKLESVDEFVHAVAEAPQVAGIFAGHVHMEFSGALKASPGRSVPVHTVPSTAYQNQTTAQAAGQPCLKGPESLPGFRVIRGIDPVDQPNAGPGLTTEVVRVALPPDTLVANL